MTLFPRRVIAMVVGWMLAAFAGFDVPGISPRLACAQEIAAPELAPNLGWLNTDRPLRFSDELKGHVVVLDFWTYCCINCMHILPDLEHLENKYKDEPFVVIGVHSAKFASEGDRQSIRSAVQRYAIRHPVVVDDRMAIWNAYGAAGWPSFLVIDSRGKVVGGTSGEGNRDLLDRTVRALLDEGKKNGTLAAMKVDIVADASVLSAGGLRFPGKVSAWGGREGVAGRLFIADSSHNRVIVATYPDQDGRCEVVTIFGKTTDEDPSPALIDGGPDRALFHDPQGMAFDEASNTLYVADTKNHAVRAINLTTNTVRTLAGDGTQSSDRRGGRAGMAQGLNSPWDVALSHDRKALYIAMAGPHQIWTLDIATGTASRLAGSGRENIADGPAEDAALAQTSGLALSTDGGTLYFADSETSSVRALNLVSLKVSTIIGEGLFVFGDVDGAHPAARLQHCLGVTLFQTTAGDRLLVADTYNHKVKLVNPADRSVQTLLGTGRDVRAGPEELRLDEPGGLFWCVTPDGDVSSRLFIADTNNHRVVMVDPTSKEWREVMISGLDDRAGPARVPEGAIDVEVEAAPGKPLTLALAPALAPGAHPNAEAPLSIRVSTLDGDKVGAVVAQRTLRLERFPALIEIPAAEVAGGATLLVELDYAYCTEGQRSLCMPGSAAWKLKISAGQMREVTLTTK